MQGFIGAPAGTGGVRTNNRFPCLLAPQVGWACSLHGMRVWVCPGARLEGWLQCFAHPLGGGVRRKREILRKLSCSLDHAWWQNSMWGVNTKELNRTGFWHGQQKWWWGIHWTGETQVWDRYVVVRVSLCSLRCIRHASPCSSRGRTQGHISRHLLFRPMFTEGWGLESMGCLHHRVSWKSLSQMLRGCICLQLIWILFVWNSKNYAKSMVTCEVACRKGAKTMKPV